MRLKIVQVGEPVLRERARPLSEAEIRSESTQQLIDFMRETMRDARGVGLAAPQVGFSLQLAVIEDTAEYIANHPAELVAAQERVPVTFHVIINPTIVPDEGLPVEFFEACLSVAGYRAIVPRATSVRVECLNERAEPTVIEARGWYARILQHEIDHLSGTIYVDRMHPRSFMTNDNYTRCWKDVPIEQVREKLCRDRD